MRVQGCWAGFGWGMLKLRDKPSPEVSSRRWFPSFHWQHKHAQPNLACMCIRSLFRKASLADSLKCMSSFIYIKNGTTLILYILEVIIETRCTATSRVFPITCQTAVKSFIIFLAFASYTEWIEFLPGCHEANRSQNVTLPCITLVYIHT